MINVITRITELTTQAASGSYGSADREAIKIEVNELSNVMMEIANTKDSQNQSLFGGLNSMVSHLKKMNQMW